MFILLAPAFSFAAVDNRPAIELNGVKMQAAAHIDGGNVYLPLRALGEALGYKIGWSEYVCIQVDFLEHSKSLPVNAQLFIMAVAIKIASCFLLYEYFPYAAGILEFPVGFPALQEMLKPDFGSNRKMNKKCVRKRRRQRINLR